MKDLIHTYLRELGHEPTRRGDTLVHRRGHGARRVETSVDLASLSETLADFDGRTEANAAAAARGIAAMFEAPTSDQGDSYSYIDVTSCLLPHLECRGFVEGVRAAGGELPWIREWQPDHFFVYYIEVDEGLRLLSAAQAENWQVHPERIEKAASSILFHRTGYRRWERQERGGLAVDVLRIGDGADAARGAILDLLDYDRASGELLFAFPSADELLFVEAEACGEQAFRELVESEFAAAAIPRSEQLFRWRKGRLETV